MKSGSRSNKSLCARCARRNGLKPRKGKCSICGDGIFDKMGLLLKNAKTECSRFDFSSFSIASRIPRKAEIAEEGLWDSAGVSNALSLKTALNSELSTLLKCSLGKEFDPSSPEITITFDFHENSVSVLSNPLCIYGHYRKLSRELSQTKWPCDCRNGCELCGGTLFKHVSVEDLVSAPMISEFHAKRAKFHGAGREDIDALMLGDGRPFIIELEEPLKRNVDLGDLQSKLNSSLSGKVELSRLSFAKADSIETIKRARLEKEYRATVTVEGSLGLLLQKIPTSLTIKQKTPTRVMHRRSDLERTRWVKVLGAEPSGPDSFELTVRTEAGTYVKELISGDGGRTVPSISQFLGLPAKCSELDVIKISHSFVSDYW